MPWRVTVRIGPKVERSSHDTLPDAIAAVRAAMRRVPRREPVNLRYKSFDPVHQVAARAEIHGPRGRRGGVDVRGDGSAEAYTGRFRRRLLEPEDGETVIAALERALTA